MKEENIKQSLGAIASPYDYRDEVAAASAVAELAKITVPASYQTDLGGDLNQNIEPACASHDVVYALRLYWHKKTGVWVDFSPRFLDTLAKRFDGQDRATGGTYIKLLMKLVVQYGCCTTAMLPNDTSLPTLQYRNDALLTPAVIAEAAKYKVPGYYAVPTDLQSTRAAIYLHGAVCMGATISNAWFSNKGEKLTVPHSQGDVAGGHATTPKGWDDAVLNRLRNQWGITWGKNDEAPYSPAEFAPYIFEQWAFAEIPANILDFLKTLPSTANFHYQWNTTLVQGMEVIGGIDFKGTIGNVKPYATDPNYAAEVSALFTSVLAFTAVTGATAEQLDLYIKKYAPKSPVTGAMICASATKENIDPTILTAVLQHESNFGTLGAGAKTLNPGNVGNVDSGATHAFASWQLGVDACAHQLARRKLPGGTDDVRFLQIAYMILGFLNVSAGIDGFFGNLTLQAVKNFQKANRLTADGVVGLKTRTVLNSIFKI